MRSRLRAVLLVAVSCNLGACGTTVPELQEFWGSSGDAADKVNLINSQVKCELEESVRQLLEDDAITAKINNTPLQLGWLRDWAAQVTLTLTIIESTSVNPGVAINNVMHSATTTFGRTLITTPQSFSMGLGVSGSSAATRTDAMTAIYRLSDFANGPAHRDRTCIPNHTAKGFLFIQSDLKLKEWLYEALLPQVTGIVQFPSTANANVKSGFITHDVKFQIVSGANATPTWKLVQVTANTTSPFFNTTRDRTQDLLITLGPIQPGTPPKGTPALATAAQNSHLAQQIGEAVAASIRGLQAPPTIIPGLSTIIPGL